MDDPNNTQNNVVPQVPAGSVPANSNIQSTVNGNSVNNELNPNTGISNQISGAPVVPAGLGSSGGVSTNDISQNMNNTVSPASSPYPIINNVSNQSAMDNPATVPSVAPVVPNPADQQPVPSAVVSPPTPTVPLAQTPNQQGPINDIVPKSNYSPFIDDEDNTTPPASAAAPAPVSPTQPTNPTPASASIVPENVSNLPPATAEPVVPSVDLGIAASPEPVEKVADTPKRGLSKGLITLFVVLGIFIIVGAIIALTEFGVMSLGLEKYYGALGIERMWGGLSAKSETGLAQSLVAMKDQANFKVKGSVNLVINKNQSNSVTDELLSKMQGNLALKDSSTIMGEITQAVLAVAEDDYSSDEYNILDEETGSDSSSSDSSSSYDYGDLSSSSSVSSDSSSSSTSSSQTEYPAYVGKESGSLKNVETSLTGSFGKNGAKIDVVATRAVGPTEFSLLLKDGRVSTKSNTVLFGDDAVADDWNNYQYGDGESDIVDEVLAIDPESGVSVLGSRVSNEKVEDIRCYKYHISSMEIGSALENLGVENDMIQSIEGDIWVQIKTKFIARIDLKINLSPSMAVSQISSSLIFYDYGEVNQIELSGSSNLESEESSDSSSSESDSSASNDEDVEESSSSSTDVIVGDETGGENVEDDTGTLEDYLVDE